MLRRLKRVLKDTRGSGYIGVAVTVIVIFMSLSIVVTALASIFSKFAIDSAASEIARHVGADGVYDDTEQQWAENYLKSCNLSNATLTCSQSGEIPQDSEFDIVIKRKAYIGSGGDWSIVPLTGKGTGRGGVYWK